ncbi:uncharacterized protein BX664DRAFT_13492 [Halteromyces radiatus]|uniref:uncharacterized protein n=1 Tax=Halteromyces radiatus TaxID=101107 RepID=UPI00222047DA|nr:uncharacterized protein BX664DRAFT_13492 [Halteromyces radiatus]KAI8099124.1 hypothetical protein BX664DRAFT_13492 [Halteromyces radiatus]
MPSSSPTTTTTSHQKIISNQLPPQLHINDLTTVDTLELPPLPSSPFSVTSLQVHEDATSQLTDPSTTPTHPLSEKDIQHDFQDTMIDLPSYKQQRKKHLKKRKHMKKKNNPKENNNNNNNIPLTYSLIRKHDMTTRTTAKEIVISAWIDNVAQAPSHMTETSVIYDLDATPSPSHYQTADLATSTTPTTGLDSSSDTANGATTSVDAAPIQETKDVFTDAQKMAYVGLCAVTSLEVVHDLKGKEFTYARMSADNWQRKLMRTIYMHMDISPEEIKMIESLSKHDILPTDFVYQFTAQGETATVNVKDLQGQHSSSPPPPPPSIPPPVPVKEQDQASPAFAPSISKTESFTPQDSIDNISLDLDSDNRDDATVSSISYKDDDSSSLDLSALPPLPPSRTHSIIDDTLSDRSISSASTISTNDEDDLSSITATGMEKYEAPEHFVIDLRWTVMCDLFLICLSLENYDARSRVFIHRMANYLALDWHQVLSFERRITEHLLQVEGAWETQSSMTASTSLTSMSTSSSTIVDPTQLSNTKERTSRNKQRKKRRYVMIGLATIGGGLILGLSAGLMAPVIAGGLGALLTTVGVTGTSTFLGGATGIGLITSAATVAGGRLGAVSMNKRMKSIGTFEFLPIQAKHQASCIISVTGWLPKSDNKEEAATLPFSILDSVMGDHYTLYWEPEMLEELGSAFKIFATEAVTFSVQQALGHTIMGALLSGLAWPLALTKLGYLVDNPWANGLDRAKSAGLILADTLMNRNLGARPVTLVGYSLGARVIFYCLEELARVNAYGLVENVALFGTPVSASKAQWRDVTSIVAGRVINGYATNDWLLGFLFRATNAGSTLVGNNVAGLHALEMIEGDRVQNMDCTDLIKGHLSYRMAMPKLLKRAGFIVTKEDIVEKKEKDSSSNGGSMMSFVMKKSGSQENADIGSSRTSSLSSGTASIQLPGKSSSPIAMEKSLSANNTISPYSSSPAQRSRSSSSTSSSSCVMKDINYSTTSDTTFQQHVEEKKETTRSSTAPLVEGVSDMDIIADIIANATAAASSKSGTYSSMSSGKASIATPSTTPTPATMMKTSSSSRSRGSGFFGFTRSRSDTASTSASATTATMMTTATTSSSPSPITNDTTPIIKSQSSSSLLETTSAISPITKKPSSSSSFWSRKSKRNTKIPLEHQQALEEECGVEIKEIKSTLGKMVVPGEVIHPMPKINLEMPQHARINR